MIAMTLAACDRPMCAKRHLPRELRRAVERLDDALDAEYENVQAMHAAIGAAQAHFEAVAARYPDVQA